MTNHYVYWIRHTNMSDFMTEGYIGVTNNPTRRIANHKTKLRNGKHDNLHFQRAYNIDEDLIIEYIKEGPEHECYAFEEQLRPHPCIGWNINKGGTKPPTAIGNRYALGSRGPVKQLISPDGIVFESRKAAAKHYGVDITTIHNWMKDPSKPWAKRKSSKAFTRHDIRSEGLKKRRPIMTPRGKYPSVKSAAIDYGVVHGTMNYWLKTRSKEFYYTTLDSRE
jgi:hypothetical protein